MEQDDAELQQASARKFTFLKLLPLGQAILLSLGVNAESDQARQLKNDMPWPYVASCRKVADFIREALCILAVFEDRFLQSLASAPDVAFPVGGCRGAFLQSV